MRLLILLILLPFITQGQIVRTHPYYKPFAASGCTPDADAQKFIDSTGITDQTQKDAICTLVRELKDSSLWSSMNAIYPFIGGTASSHKWNLKNPQNTNAAFRLTFSGGWTHSSTGATPNGSTGYANTYLNALSTLSNSSNHVSYYSRTDANGVYCDIGVVTGTGAGSDQIDMYLRLSGSLYADNGDQTDNRIIVTNSNSLGFYTNSRTASNSWTIYKAATSIGTNTTSFTDALPNYNIILGAINDRGTAIQYSPREVAFVTIGAGLTSDQARALNTIVEKFNDALGRGVQ